MQTFRALASALLALTPLVAAIACSPAEPVGEFVAREKKLYSQGNEELLIRHFFGDRRGGVFLDVGSFNWKNYSTTYYLEEHLGWSGIAIDANADLGPGYEKNRPATKFHSFIVTDEIGPDRDFHVAGAVSSTSREHVEFFMEGKYGTRKVPTTTLNQLLSDAAVEKVDFLSMDIELGEPAALAGFDIDRYRPDLVCIEAGNATVREWIAPYFDAHGYERIDAYLEHDPVNWYYRRESW